MSTSFLGSLASGTMNVAGGAFNIGTTLAGGAINALRGVETPEGLEKYQIEKQIGSGANGDVFVASPKDKPNVKYALKLINEFGDGELQALKNLTGLQTPKKVLRIVETMDSHKEEEKKILVTELVDGIDLEQLIYSDIQISNDQIQWIVAQLLVGLETLKEAKVVHFDLKPSNVMITYDCNVVIIDFGSSNVVNENVDQILSTPNYLNTDIAKKSKNNKTKNVVEEMHKFDLWCVGCIMYELYNRNFLFRSLDPDDHDAKLKEFIAQVGDESRPFFKKENKSTEDERTMEAFFRKLMGHGSFDGMPTVQEMAEEKWVEEYVNYIRNKD